MATLKEANQAREEHGDFLQQHGAHAVAVEKVAESGGKETFGVTAYYESLPKEAPATLEIKRNGKSKKIPLRTQISPVAELE